MKEIISRLMAIAIGLLIGLFCFLLFFEIFLRLNPMFGYSYSSFKLNSEQQPFLPVMNDIGSWRRGCYQPSSLLGYEHVPNCRPYTNSYGLIGKEYKLRKDKGVFRILVLGDSIAEQEWAVRFLEEELNNDRNIGSKYIYEIWNAGVASYDVRRYALFLKYKGLNYKPDMVIIFLFMNDFGINTNTYYKNQDGFTAYDFPLQQLYKIGFVANPFLMDHSSAYRFMVLKLNNYLAVKEKRKGVNLLEENGRYYLSQIEDICKQKEIPFFLVIFPYLKHFEQYKEGEKEEYSAISKIVKEMNIEHINLYNLYEKLINDGYPIRLIDSDDMHPSKDAYKLIAHEIYNYMLIKTSLFFK